MPLSPAVRKAALTTHVVASVGWVGAAASFLALAVAAVRTSDASTARALYVAMEVLGVGVLVPLSIASFLTGLLQSLGTPWGLLRHHWVVVKLAISLVSTLVLLLYTSTMQVLADAARSPGPADDELLLPSTSPVLHSGVGLLLLLLAVGLSIYKPRGLTRRGLRAQQRRQPLPPTPTPVAAAATTARTSTRTGG